VIRSMTGFGRSDFEIDGVRFEVEVRSVNHRHLDLRVRLPRRLVDREALVRSLVQESMQRGKVDVSIAPAAGGTGPAQLEVDEGVAAAYVDAARALCRKHSLEDDLGTAELLSLPGVARFVEPDLAQEALDPLLGESLRRALDELDEMRSREGEALDRDLRARLDRIVALTQDLEERSGLVQQAARERLRRRSEQLRDETGVLDEARLHQEIVIAADRLDITEELVRLRSHVEQFRCILSEGDRRSPVGRRLEFLLQEMGREANTTGSKANDAGLAHFVVDLKSELERMREQVLNIE